MRNPGTMIGIIALAGLLLMGMVSAGGKGVTPGDWQGLQEKEAADRLLEIAQRLAEGNSWSSIAVARVYYLAGNRVAAEKIFAHYTDTGADTSDLVRIARVYVEAGEWEKARPLYDRVLEKKPKDEDWLAEAGSYYLFFGDRERAETLLARSFNSDDEAVKNILKAASAYAGVKPSWK